MDERRIKRLLTDVNAIRGKSEVLAALFQALQPTGRSQGIRHFVNYYFAFEKSRDDGTLTQGDLSFIFEKCKAAMLQPTPLHLSRVKKIYTSRGLKDETTIEGCRRTHQDHSGQRGWVPGWLTAYPTDADVDLKLDTPMFVTRMMVFAVNVKASPCAMRLSAKDANGEWVTVRDFHFRVRDYEGSHGNEDYSKKEAFYVLGHASNNGDIGEDDWELHPLAGPGKTPIDGPNIYMASQHWRWTIIDSNGAGYVGINDFSLYGYTAVFPSPTNVKAIEHDNGAKITWDAMDKVNSFHIVAHPGGFSLRAAGGFYEQCDGTATEYLFANLSPGASYQFQVIPVDASGNDGIPSAASNKIRVQQWNPHLTSTENTVADEADSSANHHVVEHPPIDEIYDPSATVEHKTKFDDVDDAFGEMIRGNFDAAIELRTSNTVTLYIAGCLEDTDVERKYVSRYVIPKLQLWCKANGYDFSGIDLRWGLTSEAVDNHQTYSIHMRELERVYQSSSIAIFYFVSGEKYGTTLLPDVMLERDRDAIRENLKDSTKWVVDVAYVLDENGDPPVYRLQRISDIEATGCHFWDNQNRKGVYSLLKEIMTVMRKSEKVSEQFKKWQPSLAIAECNYALRQTRRNNRHRFLAGMRTFLNLYKALEAERDYPAHLKKAIERGCADPVERKEIHDLRGSLSKTSLISKSAYEFDWKTDGIDISREDVSMKRLCADLYSEARDIIKEAFSSQRIFTEDEQEIIHHAAFVHKRTASFCGRESLLKTTMATIAATNESITVLHGVSGAGKTSVMCVAAAKAKIYLPENTIVAVRLCGTSPQSSSAKGIMKSICTQINTARSATDESIPSLFNELVEYFRTLLSTTAESTPIAIFIDSLDQLTDEDAGRSQPLKWIPKQLPPDVYFVVSTLPDPEYGILQTLSEIHPRMIQIPLVPFVESDAILNQWIRQRRRKLSEKQRLIVASCLNALQSGITMLHLRLICDKVTQWHSRSDPPALPSTVQGMIERTYAELEEEHGKKLVAGFLSLLVASKDGLSNDNVEDILSADEDALGGRGKKGTILELYDPPVRRVPPFLIARLKYDLSEYLVERGANGMRVLGLYHRQFIEVAQKRYLTTVDKKKTLSSLAEYFNGETANKFAGRGISTQPFWYYVDDDRLPNKQKLVELPHALIHCKDYKAHANLVTNFDYIEAKCTAGGSYATSLMEDYLQSIKLLESRPPAAEVQSFFRFISTWFHVLREDPSCLTSLAMNYALNNPVTVKMRERCKQKLSNNEGWIKWNNAPEALDPCIFTNVFARVDCITALKSSPDAKRAVIGGNRFCGVYDFGSYELQGDFQGHESWIRGVCFSPDGRYVLSVSNDMTGRVWNSHTREQCSLLIGHLSWILDCAWSPQDHVVLTASEDGTARLWNPYLGDFIGAFEEHGTALKCCTFAPSGLVAVTGDADGKIIQWSVPDCQIVCEANLKETIKCIQWSGEANAIAAGTIAGDVVLLSPNLEVLKEFEGFSFSVNGCVFSPDGKELLAAGAERIGRVYNIETGNLEGRLVGHSRQITCVDWLAAPEGGYLLSGSEDLTMKQWKRSDVIPGDVFETFAEGSWRPTTAFALDFTKEGDLYGIDNEMQLFHCKDVLGQGRTAPFLDTYGTGPKMGDKTCGTLSPDSYTWAVCTYGHVAHTISRSDGSKLKDFNQDVAHNTLIWDPLEQPRFFASGHGSSATLWDADSGDKEATFDIHTWVSGGSWSADGCLLAVSCDELTAVFNMEESVSDMIAPVAKLEQSSKCALNSDGSRLAIIAKTGAGYDTTPSEGCLYDLKDITNVRKISSLSGDFSHAQNIVCTSDDKFFVVSFSQFAFGTSPSICAYDCELGGTIAWFVSPMNNDFAKMVVPYHKCSDLVAVDKSGKLFVLSIEEI